MYYHRIIVNFTKLSSGNKFILHILVNIPQDGTDLAVYPQNFTGVYMIAYGISSTVSNIDPDKVYDYHTAFDIQPTQVVYNVDINANNKKILNIALDRNSDNSAATVGMVKKIEPFTTNYTYRKYYEVFCDFTDANSYVLNKRSSGIVITGLNPNISIPNRAINDIMKDGLNISNYTITFTPPGNNSQFSLCIVFYHWRNRSFSLVKKSTNHNRTFLTIKYDKYNNKLSLIINQLNQSFIIPSIFNGKKLVLFVAENFNTNVTKVKLSNYSSTLTIPAAIYSHFQKFEFTNEDGVLSKIMFSPNFYDFDSEQFHQTILQEKLDGTYIS